MSQNISDKLAYIPTLQAAGADVVTANGQINVTNGEQMPANKLISAQTFSTFGGVAGVYNLALAATVAVDKRYTGTILATLANKTYSCLIDFITDATSGASATAFYAALAPVLQAQVTGGSFIGAFAANGSTGVTYTSDINCPTVEFVLDGSLTSTLGVTQLTAAGSSATNAAPRVLTTAAHGLTVGKMYRFSFTGVTSTGAADLNRELIGLVASATTITLFDTSATGAVDTTTGTLTIVRDAKYDAFDLLGGNSAYLNTSAYVGMAVTYESNSPLEAGVVLTQFVVTDATSNSVANVNSFLIALTNQTKDII